MNLSKSQAITLMRNWLLAWNEHDIAGVMSFFANSVIFENWTGATIIGKLALERSWAPWFLNHGDFRFIEEDIFFEEDEQKMLLKWRLEWPSTEKLFVGKPEIRQGVDILHFKDGKVIRKFSYSKTTIKIDGSQISLIAHV